MKKVLALVLTLVLALSLVGCSESVTPTPELTPVLTPTSTPEPTPEPISSPTSELTPEPSPTASKLSDESTSYTVLRVVDGDTIEIDFDGTKEKVRLIGVDTPESVHPDASKNTEFGEIASRFTEDYLLDKEIELEFDVSERDKYGRLLAYVWCDGVMFNEYLVEQGYAQVSTYPPDVKYVYLFVAAQERARNASLGLWGYVEETAPPSPTPESEPIATYVWIPRTGSKYHSTSTCSNMKNPSEVTLDTAISMGYGKCSKCW